MHADNGEKMFTLHIQPGPRGGQDPDVRGRLEDFGYQVRALDQVLEVIQDEEHGFPTQVIE